jgi:hypothetical protein
MSMIETVQSTFINSQELVQERSNILMRYLERPDMINQLYYQDTGIPLLIYQPLISDRCIRQAVHAVVCFA